MDFTFLCPGKTANTPFLENICTAEFSLVS